MFAFAIVDAARQEIILVRDRFGVKPLYFIKKNNTSLAFASVSRALAREFLCAPSLEYVARGLAYLVYENGSASAPFVGIEAVKPGTAMVVKIQADQFDIREHRYYDLNTGVRQKVEKIASRSPKCLMQELDATLENAVALRLRADVPVAVSLSGGVDSSLISAIAAEHHPGITGFCYGHPDARRSEGPTAARFARSVGLKPRFLWPRTTKQIVGAFEETVAAQDGPFYGLSIIAQNFVFREIRAAGFKVALGGQGGDESFLGYRKFAFFALIDAWRRRSLISVAVVAAHLFRMLFAEAKRGGGYWLHRGRYLSKTADLHTLNITAPSTFVVLRTDETFVGRQIRDVVETSLPTLLRYEDGNSMGHSIESRLPFLDYHVVELGVALPLALKLNRGLGKWCLREIGRDRLTKEIRCSRAKWGFAVTQDWINEGLGRHLRERITAALPKVHGLLRENINIAEAFSDRELNQRHRRLAEAIAIVWLADQM
jgi:asparagine synthase (glutamine-hydrolysing)